MYDRIVVTLSIMQACTALFTPSHRHGKTLEPRKHRRKDLQSFKAHQKNFACIAAFFFFSKGPVPIFKRGRMTKRGCVRVVLSKVIN